MITITIRKRIKSKSRSKSKSKMGTPSLRPPPGNTGGGKGGWIVEALERLDVSGPGDLVAAVGVGGAAD